MSAGGQHAHASALPDGGEQQQQQQASGSSPWMLSANGNSVQYVAQEGTGQMKDAKAVQAYAHRAMAELIQDNHYTDHILSQDTSHLSGIEGAIESLANQASANETVMHACERHAPVAAITIALNAKNEELKAELKAANAKIAELQAKAAKEGIPEEKIFQKGTGAETNKSPFDTCPTSSVSNPDSGLLATLNNAITHWSVDQVPVPGEPMRDAAAGIVAVASSAVIKLQSCDLDQYVVNDKILAMCPTARHVLDGRRTSFRNALGGSTFNIEGNHVILKKEGRILASLIKSTPEETIVALPEVKSATLERVVEYCQFCSSLEFDNVRQRREWEAAYIKPDMDQGALCELASQLFLLMSACFCPREV
jgi:hypothetical protein